MTFMYSKIHASCNFKVKMESVFYYTTLPCKQPMSIQVHIPISPTSLSYSTQISLVIIDNVPHILIGKDEILEQSKP